MQKETDKSNKDFNDFQIGFPDDGEIVFHLVPLFHYGFNPVLKVTIPATSFIECLVLFHPVIFGNEFVYKKSNTFFKHLN